MFWATDSQAAHRPLRFTPCPPGIGGRADGGAVIRRDEVTAPQADGARILVVDDEESITQLLCTALRYEGFETASAVIGRDGATAAAVRRRPPLTPKP